MAKDMLGNSVKTGDILLELGRGCGNDGKGNRTFSLKLWQKPSSNDGSGYEYEIDGTKSKYWWASVSESIKVDMKLMPNGFEYSFLHGMSDLETTIENGTLLELINNSDWEDCKVEERQVEICSILDKLEINTIQDIANNIDILSEGVIPRRIISKVFEIFGLKNSTVKNGETGISSFYDMCKYLDILNIVRKINE